MSAASALVACVSDLPAQGGGDAGTADAGNDTAAPGLLDSGSDAVSDAQPACAEVPCSVNGLIAWYRADKGVVSSSNNVVSRWKDQTTNGYDLVPALDAQDAGGTGAVAQLAGIHGHPAVYFEETFGATPPDMMVMEKPFPQKLTQPFTQFAVIDGTRTGVEVWTIGGGMNLDTTKPNFASMGYSYYPNTPDSGGYVPSVFLSAGNEVDSFDSKFDPVGTNNGLLSGVWTATFNGSLSQLWINGTSRVQGNPGGASLDGISLGRFPGYVGEFLVYAQISDADRVAVEKYLRTKYGF